MREEEIKALQRDIRQYRARLAIIRRSIESLPPSSGRRQEFRERADRLEAKIEEWARFLMSMGVEVDFPEEEDDSGNGGGAPVFAPLKPVPPARFGKDAKPLPEHDD